MSEAELESQNLQNLLKDETQAMDVSGPVFHPVAIVLWVAAYAGLLISVYLSLIDSDGTFVLAWVVGVANFFALGALGSIINLLKQIAVNTSKQ